MCACYKCTVLFSDNQRGNGVNVEMNKYFILDNNTPIYLYGAASVGRVVYERNAFLNICGFLDVRAREIIQFKGLPVLTVEQAAENILGEEAVIMLSVKNVFEHEDIASVLHEAGFDKIIYKSRAVLEDRGNIDEVNLSETWDALVDGRFVCNGKNLSCFQGNNSYSFEDYAILSRENGRVLAYLPVELIYTNIRKDKWADLNILGYYPHIYLFYYLSNKKNGQVKDYLKFAEEIALEQGDIIVTEAWRKNVLRNRTDVYENMRLNMDINPHFFYKNAPTATWNAKGYFNLTSGKHRCAFLVSQGYRYIAVSMKEEDYESFLLYGDSENLKNKIVERKTRYITEKVYHPLFYRFPCKEPIYYAQFQIEALCRVIRSSIEYGRILTFFTNLPKENSLFRLIDQCRLVRITDRIGEESIDIMLLDECYIKNEDEFKNVVSKVVWRIGLDAAGTVIAEYYSIQGTIFFCEEAT